MEKNRKSKNVGFGEENIVIIMPNKPFRITHDLELEKDQQPNCIKSCNFCVIFWVSIIIF